MSRLLTYGILQQKRIQSYLLDTYTDAAMAYSLRKLRSDYSGYCIRVKRSSDNADQDIGFVNGVLNETALTSFIGSGDGRVVTWYDQSGNGHDALSYVASRAPLIVVSGSVNKLNDKPALLCDLNTSLYSGVTFFAASNILGSSYENMTFSVHNETTSSTSGIWRFNGSGVVISLHATYSGNIVYETGNQTSRRVVSNAVPAGWLNNQHSVIGYSTGSNAYIRCDASQIKTAEVSGTPPLTTTGFLSVCSWHTNRNNGHIGSVQELIIYKTYNSGYISGIESNQNDFYSIY